jgi:hypothetical protein
MQAISDDDKTVPERVEMVAGSIGRNLVDQTYLSGIRDIFDAIAEPERYGGKLLENALIALAVPASSLSRTIAQTMDRTVRQPEGIGEAIKTNIPGLSKQVPAKLTAFGEEVKRTSPSYSPINVAPASPTVVTNELNRLEINVGFVGDTISMGTGKSLDLTREEQRAYQIIAGRQAKQNVYKLITSAIYIDMTDDQRTNEIGKAVNDAREYARETMRSLIPPAEKERRLQAQASKKLTSTQVQKQAVSALDWQTGQMVTQSLQLEQTNPKAAKALLFSNPQILQARKQVALAQLAARG